MNGWVSVMIPCYNGENFLERLFDCLLKQDYEKLHIIVADDGSTDKSAEIVAQYVIKFEKTGRKVTYLYQENKGLAGAINLALNCVEGEFCFWMDVDDRIDSKYFSKMTGYLYNNPEEQWVMCNGLTFMEESLFEAVGTLGVEFGTEEFAEDILMHRVNCTPGLYMVRTKALINAIGQNRHIYDDNRRMGQNMQLLCPMAMKYGRPGRVDEFLFLYTIRKNSLSHSVVGNVESELDYVEHIQDIKENTIKSTTFITKAYRDFLLDKISCHEVLWKSQRLQSCGVTNYKEWLKGLGDFATFKSKVASRKIAVWGYCNVGKWWNNYISQFLEETTICYVDSDLKKCDNKDVMYRENIDSIHYFLIIPIGYHKDIVECLNSKNYSSEDYIYFEEFLHSKFDGDILKCQ